MEQAFDRDGLRRATSGWRRDGFRIALVPTMGNLHDGHLALVHAARREADRVVTSVYVNPTQFGEGEDFERYPRTLEADREALRGAGCDLLFAPGLDTMYPRGLEDSVRLLAPPGLASRLEGAKRPGHFDGVVTVVARLFNLVGPQVAVFGEKDYQQLLLVRRLVSDLGYDIRIVGVPTVREASGLAMSSRNAFLDPEQRKAAADLHTVLSDVAERIESGAADYAQLEKEAARRLEDCGLQVDYIAIRRSEDLARPAPGDRAMRVLAAAFCGKTRLIDNLHAGNVGFLQR